jgi:sec-independent protein translocase protein TatA
MLSTPLLLALPGGSELIVILIIILVLFGGNKIPALGDGLGKGIKNFRRALGGDKKDDVEVVDAEVVSRDAKGEPERPSEDTRRRLDDR